MPRKKRLTPEERQAAQANRVRVVEFGSSELGRFLRLVRLDENVSMYDMDKKTKKRIGSSEISRWERGIRKPTPEMVGAYLALLGVEFDEIALEIVRLLVKDYFSRMEQGYEDEMAKLTGSAIDGSAGDGTEGGTEASNQDG